jgi:hypothetical protein
METIMLVTVVPILAPIIMGIAPPKCNAPLLTIPTIKEVVVDELWKMVVERIPINKAINGLLVVDSIFSAKSPPKCFMAVDNPLIPTRKRYNERNTPATFRIIRKFLFKIYCIEMNSLIYCILLSCFEAIN